MLVGQLKEWLDGTHGGIDPLRRISLSCEPAGDRADREGIRHTVGHLFPIKRSGHTSVWSRSHRVGRGHRPVLGVLVVIEEDAVPLLFPPLAGGEVRRAALHLPGEGNSGPADLGERPVCGDPAVDVQAARARGLRPPNEAELVQDLLRDERDLADLGPFHPAHGIEVHAELVGMVKIVCANGMGVEVDTSEVHHPGKLRGVSHDDLLGRPAGWKPQLDGLDPVGPRFRRALLEEEVSLRSVHESFQGHRSSTNTPQRALADIEVVADEVELRDFQAREEDLVGVADDDFTAGDLQHLLGRHGDTIGRAGRPRVRLGSR
jgi:hypothetical protein